MISIGKDATQIKELGPRTVPSPLMLSATDSGGYNRFTADGARMPYYVVRRAAEDCPTDVLFEVAGPREMLYFEPARTRAAVVTCGGLCPGINAVIRSIVMQLHHGYGVENVLGFRYGYAGLDPANGFEPMPLTPALVSDIHKQGGSLLGTSRGAVDPAVQVDYLASLGVQILFCVGGDGTQRGAHQIHAEAARRGYPLAVVGVPKTIDNDIHGVWRSFGYMTALEKSRDVIDSAHNEARGVFNGVAVVKLMGREAGFIAAGATLASQEVNFCLIPEIPFELEGETGLLSLLEQRLERRRHAVIVVAEGAGQHLMPKLTEQYDASGNVRFQDIGLLLRDRIQERFARLGVPVYLKYFDPSYYIRSAPPNCEDSLLSDQFARNAVHAGMAGKTDILIGVWYNVMTHVPIPLAVGTKKRIRPNNEIWRAVLQVTGQPPCIGPCPAPLTEA